MIIDFSEYIKEFASFQNDLYYYNIADDFYEKMISKLKNDNYILQNDGNILFHGNKINSEYSDLLIIFINKNYDFSKQSGKSNFFTTGYFLGSYKNYKTIGINNLDNDKIPYKNIEKQSFIHEFIHYLDYKRNNYIPPKLTFKTKKEYYNTPEEFNAYYQEAVTWVGKILEDEIMLKSFKEKFKNYNDFYNWIINNVLDKDFVKNLNPINIKKLQKRIYNIYQVYFITEKSY
jgi:hypothetical protein